MTETKKHVVKNSGWNWGHAALVCALGVDILVLASLTDTPARLELSATAFCVLAALVAWPLLVDRQRQREWNAFLASIPIPFDLALTPGFFKEYTRISESLVKIARHGDLFFRDLALTRIEAVAGEIEMLARGQITFHATETWRTAYQHLLETLRLKTYYSVAWVRTSDYWNDIPGRQSMQVNYELIDRGARIERLHILADELWPFDEKLPISGILEWLVEQQGRGIHVSLVRESDLVKEPDLIRDFAVYGDRATGTQELDENSQTVRFVLGFDEASIRHALAQWERLKLFSSPLHSKF
jgi:hypothetical protein